MRTHFAAAVLLTLLAGFSTSSVEEGVAVQDGRADLAEARERWRAAGMDDYSMTYGRSCECMISGGTVMVRDGAVVEVRGGGGERLNVDDLRNYWTVEDAFHAVEGGIESDPVRFRVTYHPEYGYPIEVDIDPDAEVVDEEIRFTIHGVNRLKD